MSGGRWNYGQCNLGYDMFPGCDVCYGIGSNERSKYGQYTESVKLARKLNPMEDRQISELVFDVLCLIYSADWYESGDTGQDDYREDLKAFKQKWLNPSGDQLVKEEIEKSVDDLRNDLMWSLCYEGGYDEVGE